MEQVLVVAIVLAGVIVLTPAAPRLKVPQPVLLTIFGLVLAAVPVVPDLVVPPELILPIVLPPLLFAAVQRTTITEFRQHAGAVLVLAVGLTVATAALVAVVAHAVGLGWSAAWVLGAVVSPPDPVAATAVARRLRLPHRLVTILEGEGMFNDATALVLYKVTVAAAVAGSISVAEVSWQLVLTVVVGVVAGLVAGVVAQALLHWIHDGYAETTITVLFPFAAYVGAEELRGSGVLAVLALGLYLRSYGHQETTAQGWLLGRAVWSYADFAVSGIVFAALGLELGRVIAHTRVGSETVVLTASVIASVVGLRFAWVFTGGLLAARRARRRDTPLPAGWQESAVVSWAGMRGVVTVATALAIPMNDGSRTVLVDRDAVVVTALACVAFTLVVQGLTLAPLTRWLGVGQSGADPREEVGALRREAAHAALERIRGGLGGADDDREDPDDVVGPVREAAILQYEGFVAAQEAMREARRLETPQDERDPSVQLNELIRRATDVERDLVLEKRRLGEVSASAADEVLRDIEARAVRDLG